ncbi:2-oxoglutarate dehydrogenase E1 component [Anaerolineae bacterium CFX9]|nr:2-oxoglutarate dehydrogenase E1 component [Anaerolineae bacterium CFX9]
MSFWNDFAGPNAGYVLELYERYRRDPASVDAGTRAFFEHWTPPEATAQPDVPQADISRVVGAVNFARALREYGHLAARLDPLGTQPVGDPALDPAAHGITEDDLRGMPASLIGGPIGAAARTALEATQLLRETYSSTIGFDYEHVRMPEEREWLRQAVESRRYAPQAQPIDEEMLLRRLTEVELFERFIHRIYPGKHRFSIEGLDMMVPILDEWIGAAGEHGIRNVLLGMAHRGRLNVLAHILGKPYKQIFAEFKDPVGRSKFRDDLGWTGDVKYHMGARRALRNGAPIDLVIAMAPNPIHLEFVNPVVQGMARAAGTQVTSVGVPVFNPNNTLPIVIHGDAAFPGQGVVAETLNMSRLPGYWVGGTLHIIANNQLGYTTEPQDSRSTLYASELAKGFRIPIIHVNADDPEACLQAARIAFAYMIRFRKDFVIDLVGYRRYGHNEGDEPAFTQPLMYRIIEKHPTVREIWGETLVRRGVLAAGAPEDLVRQKLEAFQAIHEQLDPEKDLVDPKPVPPAPGQARKVKTGVSIERLRELQRALLATPEGFTIHPKLQRQMKRRQEGLESPDSPNIDWANAEDLAVASILDDGIAVRLTGQDAERGTFSQRHAVFHDYETGAEYCPLQNLPKPKAAFEIHNSPLSEQAALGFEYGYNVQEPGRLVLWEAQYGDFDNGAQVIIDEFIVSARAKWGQTPSLVMLLPHGYEGAGPDHSSARPERFLQMAAETNLRLANPTTAAQYFHLLRRQALLLESDPLPLIVLTPKSLLRNPLVASSLNELAKGRWMPVIDDPAVRDNPDRVRRVMLCSGKIYIDLVSAEQRAGREDIAIIRVEQLYPFPVDELRAALERYTKAEEIVWVQEEPENMGAWEFARPLLIGVIGVRLPLRYLGRPRNSSPAEGSAAAHAANQAYLIEQAFSRKGQAERQDIASSES